MHAQQVIVELLATQERLAWGEQQLTDQAYWQAPDVGIGKCPADF